jgi:MYXO-CTERM domain-containing protein
MVRDMRPYPAAGMPLEPRHLPTTRRRARFADDTRGSLIVPGGAAAVAALGIGGLVARRRRRRA